jgi:hypothetical protein
MGDFTGKYVMGTCCWGVEPAKDYSGPAVGKRNVTAHPTPPSDLI